MARIPQSPWSLPLLGKASLLSGVLHTAVLGGAALGIWNWIFFESPAVQVPPAFEVQFRPDSVVSPEREVPLLEVLPPEVPEPRLVEWEEAPFEETELEIAVPSFVSVSSGRVEAEPDPEACPPPIYPRSAVRLKLEGVVRLWVIVGANGAVEDLGIQKSSSHDVLDQSSLKAVAQWHFLPAEDSFGSFPSRTTVQIRFQL